MPRHTLMLASISLALLFFAPAALASDPAPAPKNAATPAATAEALPMGEAIKPGLAGSFLSGRFARHNQDLNEAAKYLGHTLERDPQNKALMHETMRMNLLAGNTDAAIALARRLESEVKNDPLVATLLMLERVQKGDYKKARSIISGTAEVGLYGVVRPVVVSWLDIGGGNAGTQVDLQAAINKSGFFSPFILYHQALMNDVIGNDVAARDSYLKASADPAITPYRVVEAVSNYYQRRGNAKEAQAVFDAYGQANPDSTLLPDPITANANVPAPLVANAREGLAELFFTTASILFGEEASQETFLYLRVAVALKPDLPPAQLMLANLYEQIKDHENAIAIYRGIAPGSVFYRRGQIRSALNYEAMGKTKTALRLLDRAAQDFPNDNSAMITKGDMLREQQQYEEAAGAYTDAIARAEPLKQNDWPLLYARGISFERDGEWNKAEADFLRALTLEPNQPDVLNYLGYSWLAMGVNIPKAREYLELAASARPEDAHIIDSVGWAHYLSGDFHAAVEQLEKAANMMPDDATVNEHLGDAYWRVGRQNEARFQWKRALTFKPEPAQGEIIRNKLENGLAPFMNQQSANDERAAAPASVASAQQAR